MTNKFICDLRFAICDFFKVRRWKFSVKSIAFFALVVFLSTTSLNAQVASGGIYTLEQTVTAAGGGASTDITLMMYKVEGTTGQNAAGVKMSGGNYSQIGGFWTPEAFAPTSANLRISGRVVFGKNTGIKDVTVILNGGLLTAPRITRTNQFGNFTFEDVDAGDFYILSVQHKRYTFANNTQSFTLIEDRTDIVFEASGQF